MNPTPLLFTGWNASPLVLLSLAGAALAYERRFGARGQWRYFVSALALLALALLSPLNLLANGVLFSAHMAQHILLLLLVPALLLLSLPRESATDPVPSHHASRLPVALCWVTGVGAMWFWHVPRLCDAAATTPAVHALQTASLLAMGTAFWVPILSPRAAWRLSPGLGIAYLFTACLACTGLGILLTLTPVQVCSAFTAPSPAPAAWTALRDGLGARRDQQIGGLLMWLPMCLVYVAGIVLELARWLGDSPTTTRVMRTSHP